MRRENADALTAREREVLDLIRLGLTNEEIAGRLGITLDGAKYHVSQILSKLGVASREEAAAVGVAERRPWWLRAAVWTKIAGAGTVVAGVAGPAVLAWGVLRTEGGDEPVEASCVVPSVAQQRGANDRRCLRDNRNRSARVRRLLSRSGRPRLAGRPHGPHD